MTRALAVLLLLVLLLAVYGLMYAGWSRRRRRHPGAVSAVSPVVAGDEPVGASGPADDVDVGVDGVAEVLAGAEGVYVSTVSERSRHDRVTAAGLGARARARMAVHTGGVRWDREGAAVVRVDASRIVAAGRSAGMAGKFVGQQRLVTVTWLADDGTVYDTGFLPRYRADADMLLAAVEQTRSAVIPPPHGPEPRGRIPRPGSDPFAQPELQPPTAPAPEEAT
jgi:hypothetical protein